MTHAATIVPRPPHRVFTRVLLPTLIVAGAVAAVLWSGWRTFAPATPVRVLQVVMKSASDFAGDEGDASESPAAEASTPQDNSSPAGSSSGSTQMRLTGPAIQAPGWLEPAPFPVMVTALTPGTVKDVLVLEGQKVSKDQVLVTLYDQEQVIALRLAEAALQEQVAKRAEMADELLRKRKLVESGAVSQAEVARLALRLDAMDAGTAAATAERDMKALILERTQVRAPSEGVVMTRLVSPGMTAGSMQDGKPLIELYNPAHMQVRADVPLADAGLVAIGQLAEIQVDVLPDRVFRGTVVRMVHLADIAKNTVQAKILITDPAPELKPEMLARVRIFPRAGQTAEGAGGASDMAAGRRRLQLWAPAEGIQRGAGQSTHATALVVIGLQDGRGIAERRELTLTGMERDGWLEVSTGLRAGDLLVDTRGAQPQAGDRVRVMSAPSNMSGDPHANH